MGVESQGLSMAETGGGGGEGLGEHVVANLVLDVTPELAWLRLAPGGADQHEDEEDPTDESEDDMMGSLPRESTNDGDLMAGW